MSSSLALLLWFVLLLALFCFDPAREPTTSPALWVPVIWLFIAGSRLPSQWLAGGVFVEGSALEEGSPLDRAMYSALIIMSFIILASRSFKWHAFFQRNFALTGFLGFALLSVLWSDYPFIAFKRWFRDLGDYVLILVVLSDRRPLDAVRTVLRRFSYLVIPLSILLIKYFESGRHYSFWTGVPEYVGATTSKNTLGGICVVSGLTFFWDTATRWPDRKNQRTRRVILVNVAFIAMTIWLLNLSDSATSRVCLLLGCLVITAAHSRLFQRRPRLLQVLIPVGYLMYVTLAFGLGLSGDLAGAIGRDPTFTGRTVIWDAVLSIHTNPLVGTGYETFWVGPRLLQVWAKTGPGINEAHNGFLDIYLTLGLIGVILLIIFLVHSYGTICKGLKSLSGLGSFGAAAWTTILFASTTEAVLKNGLPWMILLLGTVVVQGAPRLRRASGGAREEHFFGSQPADGRIASRWSYSDFQSGSGA